MNRPDHHPADELLLDYADGSLPEAAALIVATHLALCPECRREVAVLEAIGGAFLEEVEPMPVSADCRAAVMARLDDPEPQRLMRFDPLPKDVIVLPQPLRSYVGAPLGALKWRTILRGIETVDLDLGEAGGKTRLMRIRAGVQVPRHSHGGIEMTLVLEGGFSDQLGRYRRGDLTVHDRAVDHAPQVDQDGDCLCLAVTDAPLRLTGRFGRLLNPFLRL